MHARVLTKAKRALLKEAAWVELGVSSPVFWVWATMWTKNREAKLKELAGDGMLRPEGWFFFLTDAGKAALYNVPQGVPAPKQ